MTIAALIINVFPLFKVTNFCQVDFAIGCWIYSILCECGIIASNFVFNIRFMQRISPLNLLDSLLNLIYQVFKFLTQLWKSLLVGEWQHISANIDSHFVFCFVCILYLPAGVNLSRLIVTDIACSRWARGATSCRQWRNLTSNQSPLQHPPKIISYITSPTPTQYILYQLSITPKPWPNHFSPHSGGLNSI